MSPSVSDIWTQLPPKIQSLASKDEELLGLLHDSQVTFGVASNESAKNGLIATINNGRATFAVGDPTPGTQTGPQFTLFATRDQWDKFLQLVPPFPCQSYFGLFGMNIQQQGVHTDGDQDAFVAYAHIWRRVLELARNAANGKSTPLNEDPPESTDLKGGYKWIDAPGWGRAKVFYETAGNGPQHVLFMHTAGSDSRQYHAVMENPEMQKRCTMFAFDLPAHGRSFPVPGVYPGGHGLTEEKYIGVTKAMIDALKLNKPVIAGASMAGQLMLNIAVRAKEFPPLTGVIPMQGAELVELDLPPWCRSPKYNQSLFAPEYIIGMIAPQTSESQRRLIYHGYSAQAFGIFHGDLDYYFYRDSLKGKSWDGRNRVDTIDTKLCPVVGLCGEYDWSNTPEMSKKTMDKIKGGHLLILKGLGHFPATENPQAFARYFLQALDLLNAAK